MKDDLIEIPNIKQWMISMQEIKNKAMNKENLLITKNKNAIARGINEQQSFSIKLKEQK